MIVGRAATTHGACLLLLVFAAGGVPDCGTVGSLETPRPHTYRPSRRLILPSGLTVYAEEDGSVPVAGVVWTVRCGAAQDPPGREGLAHAVEHLVFRAPATTGFARHERLMRLGAADLNGETGWDETTYHTFVHQGAAGALLDLESAAMADPLAGIDQESFTLEMGVVREELAFHDLPGERRTGIDALERAVFPARHPYARAVGGTPASLGAITLADARAFAASCYQPRNMAMVLAGPIPPGWPDALVARLPPRLRGDPAHPLPARLPPPPARGAYPSPRAAVAQLDAAIAGPEVWVGWALPPAVGADVNARQVLAQLVRGLLRGGLENEGDADDPRLDSGQLVVATPSGQFGGMLLCRARLPSDSAPDREADAIIEHVSSLWRRLNEDQAWFERVRVHTIADVALDQSDLVVRVRDLAHLLETNTAARPADALDRVSAVSFVEALGWAGNFLGREQARVVIVRPSHRRATATAPPALWTGHHAATAASTTPIPPGQRVTEVAQPIGAARASTRRLANGLTVTVLRRPGAPLTDLVLGFHAAPEPEEDPAVRAGFSSAWQLRYSRRPSELGISHHLHLDADSLSERIEVLAGHEEEGLAYLGRAIGTLEIEWPSERFQRWATLRRNEEGLAPARAQRNFAGALWRGHPYGERLRVADLEEVESSELEHWLARVRRPSNGTLIVVGDVDPERIYPRIEAAIGGWGKADAIEIAPPAPPVLPASATLRLIPHRLAGQDAAALHLGCLLPAIRDEGQRTTNRMLARWLNDRLRESLRTHTGASYAPHATSNSFRGGAATLEGWADVQTPALRFAVETVQALFKSDAPNPFDAATLEQLRWAEARDSNLRYRTNRQLANALLYAWNMGWPPASLDEVPARLQAVTLADLDAALRACRASAVLTVVGDTSTLGTDGAR